MNLSQNAALNDLSGEFESIIKQKKKFSFVLNYAMNVSLGTKDEKTFNDLEQAVKNESIKEEEAKHLPKINMDQEAVDLLSVIQ